MVTSVPFLMEPSWFLCQAVLYHSVYPWEGYDERLALLLDKPRNTARSYRADVTTT